MLCTAPIRRHVIGAVRLAAQYKVLNRYLYNGWTRYCTAAGWNSNIRLSEIAREQRKFFVHRITATASREHAAYRTALTQRQTSSASLQSQYISLSCYRSQELRASLAARRSTEMQDRKKEDQKESEWKLKDHSRRHRRRCLMNCCPPPGRPRRGLRSVQQLAKTAACCIDRCRTCSYTTADETFKIQSYIFRSCIFQPCKRSCIFRSCIFQPCKMVLHFPKYWSCIFRSCIFRSSVFSAPPARLKTGSEDPVAHGTPDSIRYGLWSVWRQHIIELKTVRHDCHSRKRLRRCHAVDDDDDDHDYHKTKPG